MEVKRGEDVTNNVPSVPGGNDVQRNQNPCITATQDSPSLSFSSDRFVFNETPDEEEVVECINKSGHLFAEFRKKPPTLEEALRSMGYEEEKSKELTGLFMKRAKEKLDEFEAPGLAPEDVAAIFCYTYEWDSERFGDAESPYRKLNNSLSIDRSNRSLKKTRGFLFLLLQALRKLPHYTPVNGVLYRGIRTFIQTAVDPEFPKTKPYAAGNEKVWWTFTSTTDDLEATKRFIGRRKGTLFTMSGKPWGYDISMFSDFPDEKEILLEPERKLKIASVTREGDTIAVNAEMVKTPLVLEDLIKVKPVKIKEKKSKVKEAPRDFRTESVTWNTAELSWSKPGGVEDDKVLSYQVSVRKAGGSFFGRSAAEMLATRGKERRLTVRNLEMGERYEFRVQCKFSDGWGNWSEKIEVKGGCVWKECPDDVDEKRKYSVDAKNSRIATKVGNSKFYCTIIGNTPLPLNKVTSWNIKVLKSWKNDGEDINIGVAPFDISQNDEHIYQKCGWYFYCYDSTLWSGPPHDYIRIEYGPRKEYGEYVHTGDSVGVVMDTTKGELSFALNGVNHGIAYEGIPLDKPLVPCALLYHYGDSVELDTSEVKENIVDSSMPIPFGIAAKSTTWDSITLTWDAVEGASLYQIEVDGSKQWDGSTTSTFIKRGLLADTEHSFRVRGVRGNSMSEWSNSVTGRTKEMPTNFTECIWKECPEDVNEKRKYSVDAKNPRIAAKNEGDNYCTIIGNTPLPPNQVTSWNIKILKSWKNNGSGIFIGVAPFGIDQNDEHIDHICGWYFYCYDSTLWSGPPHNYRRKEYGPRKRNGEYVHTGDSVGVVMDTAKGKLSFALKKRNLGVAYEGIPLDKPLVPCVILGYENDSVELII